MPQCSQLEPEIALVSAGAAQGERGEMGDLAGAGEALGAQQPVAARQMDRLGGPRIGSEQPPASDGAFERHQVRRIGHHLAIADRRHRPVLVDRRHDGVRPQRTDRRQGQGDEFVGQLREGDQLPAQELRRRHGGGAHEAVLDVGSQDVGRLQLAGAPAIDLEEERLQVGGREALRQDRDEPGHAGVTFDTLYDLVHDVPSAGTACWLACSPAPSLLVCCSAQTPVATLCH